VTRLPRAALAAALSLLPWAAGCAGDDEGRPGFPRTARTPIAGSPIPYILPEEVGLAPDEIWRLKERLYARVVARHLVGAEIVVVKDGGIVLHQAMGWADRDERVPMDRNTVFRLASMTKPLVGTATLLLVEEGRLGLDDRVGDHLDSFDNERSGRITVRHLLTHRSGFAQGTEPPGYTSRSTLREAVDLLGRAGPDVPPGERFIYSNLNSEILGAVVEEIAGEPVDRFLESRVLSPLVMGETHTRLEPGSPRTAHVASSYRRWGDAPWERYWSPARAGAEAWFNPAGDLLGTAVDYAKFLAAWIDSVEGRSGGLVTQALARDAISDPDAGPEDPPRPRYFGMHWEIYAPPSDPGGLPAFGHRGATGTVGLAIPDRAVIVVFLTNSQETEVVEEVIQQSIELFGR
jgi:CubicO group peptidase (beta-lactamase class C family)